MKPKTSLLLMLFVFSVPIFSQVDRLKLLGTWQLKKIDRKAKTLVFNKDLTTYGTRLKLYKKDSIFEFYSAPCGNSFELWRTVKQGTSTFYILKDTLYTNNVSIKNFGNKFLILNLTKNNLILKKSN